MWAILSNVFWNYILETNIKNSFQYKDIFNNLSFHRFELTKKLPPKSPTVPKYSEDLEFVQNNHGINIEGSVSVQGVKSLGGHFSCLCGGFEFYEVRKNFVIIFLKENGSTFTLLIIFIVKSLQKEQNSTNLLNLLWQPICRNKPAITPKWFNSLDTNST